MTEHFRAPAQAQVKEALRRIPTLQLRRAFFEGLRNPLWVEPLVREGAFTNPPEPEVTNDGLIRDVYWPEIDYLIRMAPQAPELVVDVLLKLTKSNNAWVRRCVFTVGTTIPASQAARLQPLIKSWTQSGFGWRTDPRELVGLAVNLLQGGQYEVGKWFATLLFEPAGAKGRRKTDFVLEAYWYEEGLPRVGAVLGDDGLSVVLPWLVAYERHDGRLKVGSDLTYFTRGSIRHRGDSHSSVEQVLIDVVRDLAVKAMLLDAKEAKSSLLNVGMVLARKIALFGLAEAISLCVGDDDRLKRMLGVAAELLFDPDSLDDPCRVEYAELTRSVATRSSETLEALSDVIQTGSRANDEPLRQWFAADGVDEEVLDERVEEYQERWQHRWLSAIGVDALPEQLRTKLAELDSRFGVIEFPLEPENRITMWTGPNSPVAQDQMSVMSPAELVTHLESWHDTGNGWGPEPSHEGQGRELTALITTNPRATAGVRNLVGRLRPTYLRAILRGWEASLKADLELDWAQVAELIHGVLTHGDESTFPVEGGQFDDDGDFRAVKQAAVGLLEQLVRGRSAFTVPDEATSRFADMLLTLADDETAWSEYASYESNSGMDPLTISLNWQWPIRVRGLVYLIARGKGTNWYGAARSALERELARNDPRGASRAVLGEGLGRLLSADAEWLESRVALWFGDEAGITVEQQIALTTAMAVHHYHPKLYELLSLPMIAALRLTERVAAGWRTHSDPLQRIGEWVVHALIRGDKILEDPVVEAFFASTPAKLRGETIGHVAWSFMHAESVDDAIRDRFAELWDARVGHVRSLPDDKEELNGFYWFVKSKKFDVEWWLPRLNEAVELDPYLCKEIHMIGKEIASAADIDPRGSFDVLKLILEGRDAAGVAVYDLTQNAVPMVLARAIASGDDGLKREAEAYMNELGEKGNLHLESEVFDVLNGRITQSDITD